MPISFETDSKSRNFINLLLVAAGFLLVSACVFSTGKEPDKNDVKAPSSPAASPSATTKSADSSKKEDKGDFVVRHLTVANSRYEEIDRKIRNEKLLEKAADDLNKALILPKDIYLQSKDCGEPNAQFDPETETITVCYELMEHFYQLYRSDGMKPEDADKKMFQAVRFAFLHEVGHALIFNYDLPVTGNEEDAADRCSSYINIEELGDEGVKNVLAAADAFHIESKQSSSTKRDLADEHLLQEQRFYNSLCMIYGSDAEKYQYFVTDGYLPKERAVRCPMEYQRAVDSWVNLLKPWRKDR
ncbi:MAG: hypothetical protein JSS81_21195 [Acidobacteria bacterium]|nr:hypothetical protein [Acidobacteriota bacterium]